MLFNVPLPERRGSVDRSALSDRDVQQRQRVDHRAAPADRAARCRPALSVPGDQAAQPLDGPSPVAVHGQHVSDLGRQAVAYRDLAPPGFVDRRDLDPVPERRGPVADDLPDVLDHRAVVHVIPGHIASDIGDQHAVAHRAVVKRRAVYAAAAGPRLPATRPAYRWRRAGPFRRNERPGRNRSGSRPPPRSNPTSRTCTPEPAKPPSETRKACYTFPSYPHDNDMAATTPQNRDRKPLSRIGKRRFRQICPIISILAN